MVYFQISTEFRQFTIDLRSSTNIPKIEKMAEDIVEKMEKKETEKKKKKKKKEEEEEKKKKKQEEEKEEEKERIKREISQVGEGTGEVQKTPTREHPRLRPIAWPRQPGGWRPGTMDVPEL
ncbi:hypothetical protein HZH66_014581 [Vespula vulgaris]|uniref:Uncharacterized protein n=1 Tax=Vespula vulgaris TaxID=7454 RepID=A0A834J112_VESVU|nr:hypothetical protein HZH66_014581 [Vespula vulgaris]